MQVIKLFKVKIDFCNVVKVYFSIAFLGKGKNVLLAECFAYTQVAHLWDGHMSQNGSYWKAFGNLKETEKWIFYKEISGSLKNSRCFWVICHDMYINSCYVAHNASFQGGDFLSVKSVAVNSEVCPPSSPYMKYQFPHIIIVSFCSFSPSLPPFLLPPHFQSGDGGRIK